MSSPWFRAFRLPILAIAVVLLALPALPARGDDDSLQGEEITRAVKMRFDEEDISIPFPQRDVHLHGEPTKAPAA